MYKKMRNDFPFFKYNKDIIYFDSASTSLKLNSVIESTSNYYKKNGANVHRGVYQLAEDATSLFEETRTNLALLLNCDREEVIFTKGTTDSLNNIATSLGEFINEGDEIITSELEHHSSLLPWQVISNRKNAKLVYVPLTDEGKITLDNFIKVLTPKTKIVALNHVSNALGFLTPIKDIVKAVRSFNKDIIVILDGAQSVSHKKIDVKDLDIDFLAFSAHKMYGPNGVGVMYGKRALLEKIEPFEYGGEMANIVDFTSYTYKELPYKFEAGTPNIAGVIGFNPAVRYLLDNDLDEIFAYEMSLKDYLLSELIKNDDIDIYNVNTDSPVITFNVKTIHPHDIASVLSTKGISLRAGHHCAQLVNKRIEQISTLRISFAVYNSKDEIDKFIVALNETIDFFKEFGI